MTYRIKAGLLNKNPYWAELLSQIGIPFEIADLHHPQLLQEYSVLIINGEADVNQLQTVRAYYSQGGAVLDTGAYLDYRHQNVLSDRYFRNILPSPDERFHYVGRIDLHQFCKVFAEAQYLDSTVYLPDDPNQPFAFLGWRISSLMSDFRVNRKPFYTKSDSNPNEMVSKVSRGSVRRTLAELLKELHHRRSLPMVHKWNFPADSHSFCGFRIDTDEGSRNSLSKLYSTVTDHQITATWFLHVVAHQEWLDYFRDFESSQEIALHGFRHQTYRNYEKNYENILKAVEALKTHHLDFKGFCAPYGLWNPSLQRAIEDLGITYSSEFAFDYDNLPHRPIIDDRPSRSWQLPIHPIGIGRLQRAGLSSEQIYRYLQQIVTLQKSRFEPIILYHHPNESGLDIWSRLYRQHVVENSTNNTLGSYIEWWKERNQITLDIQFNEGTLYIDSNAPADDVKMAIYPMADNFSLESLQSEVSLEHLSTISFAPRTPLEVEHQFSPPLIDKQLLKDSILTFIHRRGK